MYHEKRKLSRPRRLARVMAGLLLAVLLIWGGRAFWQVQSRALRREAALSLRETVLQAARQCYAVEGAYPTGIDYLEQAYGLQINHEWFIVDYQVFASNQPPEVAVLER